MTEDEFMVSGLGGIYSVIEHSQGTNLRLVHKFKNTPNIKDMGIHGNLLFILSFQSVIMLDINSSFKQISEIAVENGTAVIAVCASRIFVGSESGKLHFYLHKSGFPFYFVLDANVERISAILILTDDLIACSGRNGCISFVSISNQNVTCVMDVYHERLESAVVLLGDCRVAVCGSPKGSDLCAEFEPILFLATASRAEMMTLYLSN